MMWIDVRGMKERERMREKRKERKTHPIDRRKQSHPTNGTSAYFRNHTLEPGKEEKRRVKEWEKSSEEEQKEEKQKEELQKEKWERIEGKK